jgi:Short C-terminal domain
MATSDVRLPHRGGVYALVVAGTIAAFLSILAIWVQRQVLDGDNWTRSSSQLLEDPAIRSVVSGYLVDQLYANVDVAGELRARLPPQTRGLAGPAAGGLRSALGNLADQALQRPRVQAAWEQANRTAHAQLMRVLNGGGSAVNTQNGVVSLDLTRLLTDLEGRSGIGGRLAGRLPPGAANVVILRSNQLKAAQNIASALRPLAIGLTALMLVLYALAIWLARGWRRRAVRAAGVGLIIAGAVALLVRRFGGDQVVESLATTATLRPAVAAAWGIQTSLLASVAHAAIAYGLVAVLGAWLAGQTVWAVSLRGTLAPYLRDPAYAWGGLAVLVLALLVWAPTQALRQPVTALVLIALLAGGFEALRRQTASEFPEGERRATADARAAAARMGAVRGWARAGGGPAGTEPAAETTDTLGRLERAAALHDRGVLTDDEFAAEKRAILDDSAPAPA